jgi:PAS domain S-box-containing protein/putative nucleotidyltransferase with HDIG domain
VEIRKARTAAEEGLRKSEALYRTLVDTSPDAIVVTDLNGRIRMANPQARILLGRESLAEMVGEQWLDSFPPANLPAIERALQTIRQNGRVELDEIAIPRRDGPAFFSELSGALLMDGEGKPDSILFVLHDITSRKKAEDQIRRQLDRLAALRTIDAAITASLDLRVTLMVILDALTSQLRLDAADILLLLPHSQSLHFASGRGFRTPFQKEPDLRIGSGHAGTAALGRKIVSVPRLSENGDEPQRMAQWQSEGFVSYIAAPLLSKGQVKGVLEVFKRAPLDPDAEWLSYLETVAEQTAIAIDNASLFEDLQRSNVELTLAYDATIEGWSRALDLRDHETEGHTRRVTETTLHLAREIGIPESELIHVRRGCLLHDIGKMAIPDRILLKPGALNEDEWTTMREHPTFAFEMLSPIAFLRPTLDIPYCHHEKYDGSGYPRGLRGDQIPLAARIFTVVDVWDALRSDRPYRQAWPDQKVFDHLRAFENTHFDPVVLRTFMDVCASLARNNPPTGGDLSKILPGVPQ